MLFYILRTNAGLLVISSHHESQGVARISSVGHLGFLLVDIGLISLIDFTNTGQTKQVGNTIAFDFLIEWGVTTQSRCKVDLEEPRLQAVVDEDIKAEQLEAV